MNNYFSIIEKYTVDDAPVKLEPLLDELGILLDKNASLEDGIAGMIQYLPDSKQFKIFVTKTDHYFRKRFTMAHELGHYLFHQDLLRQEGFIQDGVLYRSNSPSVTTKHEVEANQFAVALLLPLRHVRRDHESIKDIKQLATKWQVSPRAMKIRLGLPV